MKILVTGGCGFVGTNIALFLSKKNYRISTLDNLSRKGSRYNLNLLKKNKIKNYKFDIAKYNFLKKLPKYDLIIDCCAEAAVEVSQYLVDGDATGNNEVDKVTSLVVGPGETLVVKSTTANNIFSLVGYEDASNSITTRIFGQS